MRSDIRPQESWEYGTKCPISQTQLQDIPNQELVWFRSLQPRGGIVLNGFHLASLERYIRYYQNKGHRVVLHPLTQQPFDPNFIRLVLHRCHWWHIQHNMLQTNVSRLAMLMYMGFVRLVAATVLCYFFIGLDMDYAFTLIFLPLYPIVMLCSMIMSMSSIFSTIARGFYRPPPRLNATQKLLYAQHFLTLAEQVAICAHVWQNEQWKEHMRTNSSKHKMVESIPISTEEVLAAGRGGAQVEAEAEAAMVDVNDQNEPSQNLRNAYLQAVRAHEMPSGPSTSGTEYVNDDEFDESQTPHMPLLTLPEEE